MTAERAAKLVEAAAASAALWARSERESLHAEGRRVEGGWPGTLSQAREYLRGAMPNAAVQLSYEELSWLTRTLYDCARRDWLAARDPAPEGPEKIDHPRPRRFAW